MNQINNSKKIYHAAIYVRLSKEDGDVATAGKRESNSISNQKDLIKNFLKDKKDIVVVSERVDDGYSGSNFERPAFQMMLEDIKKGIVDCVVVKDLSRFGREYIDAGKYIERLFPALGVRFIAVNDHYDSLEGKSQADEIVIPFKNLINDAYCRDISIKIRSHLEVKRKNGEYIGAFTPYGYQKDSDNKNKLVIDAYAAGIVKEIYRMKLSGMSQTAIANALNKQGVLSPMEYKHSLGIRIQDNFKTHEQAEWSAMSVKRILENEVYTGTLVQGKRTTPNHKVKKLMKKPETDWVRIEKNHEAIVSEREFALVQRLLGIDTRTSPNEEKVYPLSGLVVCGDCGAMMIKRDVPAGGKVYAYYICSRHAATKACAAHRIPMGKLEETVLELVKIHIENILDMKKIMDFIHEVPFQELDIKELEIRKEAKEKEAVRCRELRDYLYEDFREGIISKEDYKELHDGYTEKRKKAEEAVRSIDQQISEVLESKSDKYHWLVEDAKAGRIKSIVIKDFSRFGRDYLEVGNYLEKILPVLGIRIISINDGFDSINSSGFTGGMSVALKNMLNAMYSRDLSRKVRSAMKTHAKNGEYMPAFPKYGYIKDPEDKHHLVIDPEAAEIVKLIFTMAADGKTKGQIAKHLNETHVLTCREYMCRKGIKMHRENEKEKKLWSVTTISDMLKNEVYLGKIIWNKKRVARTGSNKLVSNDKEEWIVVENAHEPIISDELFQKANEKAFTNQKRVLTKRGVACPIFFCPTCGRRLGFTSRETGYRCMQAHISGLSGCAESKMDRKEAEETVLDAARNMAQLISENLEKKKSEWHKTILKEENIATLESEKKRLSSRKMKLYSDYRSEVLDKEGYMEELEKTTSRISEITLQIAELENEIAVAKKKCDEATEKEMEVNEIAALQDFDKIQLSKIIEKVFIYEPGRMEISWKMDDIFYKEEKA